MRSALNNSRGNVRVLRRTTTKKKRFSPSFAMVLIACMVLFGYTELLLFRYLTQENGTTMTTTPESVTKPEEGLIQTPEQLQAQLPKPRFMDKFKKKWSLNDNKFTHSSEPNMEAQKNIHKKVIRNTGKQRPWPKDERVDLNPTLVQTLKQDAKEAGKGPVLDVLLRAGTDMDESIVKQLPTWKSVTDMYGSEPVIVGLDTCEAFQSNVDIEHRWITPAGIFNTGTNLMAELLERNCYIPFRKDSDPWFNDGQMWQVPWGKHSPASWRLIHMAKGGGARIPDQRHALPVVVVKDPYTWMSSMCRNPYVMKWFHRPRDHHCPNLVATKQEQNLVETVGPDHSIPVLMWYRLSKPFDSLAHVWNDWYGQYFDTHQKETDANKKDDNVNYPRLIVRYEDLLFNAEKVIKQVCACGGGKMRFEDKLMYKHEGKKGAAHKADSPGLIKAVIRYGNEQKRQSGFLPEDLEYAQQHLRPDLMKAFHYNPPLKKYRTSS